MNRLDSSRQVIQDHQLANTRKPNTKNLLSFGTWNVRTLNELGKLENVIREMDRMKISLMGLSEVRWIGTGSKDLKYHKFIYSGGSHHERGVGVV